MPAVFVHGVPDTPRVWRDVIGNLVRKDCVTLALPGFDSRLPEDLLMWDGCGHWPTQRPVEVARALERLWSGGT